MQYPSLAQLAKMTSEQRKLRLRGIDAFSQRALFDQAAELLADINYRELYTEET
ncbi:hypothetical protein SEA_LUNA18_30 [Microbacterium phage Luna18]|nr:hypothetical protein SEA_CHEPLI_30 [Microbacterium phage Chepli]QZE10318.1 hypothetical protein SEA_KATCHAN_30 [Microbacterium phage KatChan]URQ04881.1 hypothetical protein SEA_LUNA18_30 [Microbacterium phage Luna18]